MSATQHKPDFDLDQDLFDFGEVDQDSSPEPEEDLEEILASFRDPAHGEELLAVPVAAATARAAPLAQERRDPAVAPAATPRAERGPAAAAEHPESGTALPARLPAVPRAPLSKGLLAIALSVTLVNSIVGVVVLRTSTPRHDVQAVEGASVASEAGAALDGERVSPAPAGALPDPESAGTAPGHPALDAARAEISHGQYAQARQRAYALLAIIDRLDDTRREALEAECQFLIAQALHLEALDRMGGAR